MKLKPIKRLVRPIERYWKDRVTRPIKRRLKYELACRYRSLLRITADVCFIGVTGSCGKTTTTELLAAILATEGPTRMGSYENTVKSFPNTVLAVSRRDRFCVNEVSGHKPGVMEGSIRVLQPRIGVVTHVGQDHYTNFRTLDLTAAEKGKLVAALPADGTAVLRKTGFYYTLWRHERLKQNAPRVKPVEIAGCDGASGQVRKISWLWGLTGRGKVV